MKITLSQKIFLVFSVLVSLAAGYYFFHNVSFGKVLLSLRELSLFGLLAFVSLSFLGSLIRAWRYQLLLKTVGYSAPTGSLWLITLVRNFFADLLPARLGTLIYIYLAKSRLSIPTVSATSSFALAFLFDFIALPLVLFVVVAFDSSLAGTVPIPFILALLLGAFIFLSGIVYFLPEILSLIIKVTPFFKKFLTELSEELILIKDRAVLLKLLIYSIFVRLTKYLSLIVFLFSILTALGYSPEQLSVAKAFIGILTSEIAASLPFSGIAGFGLYESTWAVMFRKLGLPGEIADVTAVSHHLFTQVYGYGLGILALWILLMIKIPNPKTERRDIPFFIKIIFSSVVIYFALALSTYTPDVGAENRETDDHSESIEPVSAFDGGIIFDSNRGGKFGIYFLGDEVKELVQSDNHEMYPDVSPIDNSIVFARSRTTKRIEPGEVWRLHTDGRLEKLFSNGTFPTFIEGGKAIMFERNRSLVMRYDIQSKEITRIFPKKKRSQFKKAQIVKPRLSLDGRYLAFTSDIPSPWNAWVIDLQEGSESKLPGGCEPTFHPTESLIAYINKSEVYGGSGVYKYSIGDGASSVLHDPHIPFGHEYFPTYSPDGKYLLYSSAPNDQHSHLTANYELFIMDLNDEGSHQRLTDNSYTDRWPKFTSHNW